MPALSPQPRRLKWQARRPIGDWRILLEFRISPFIGTSIVVAPLAIDRARCPPAVDEQPTCGQVAI